jgi:hypothetical protein
VKIAFPNKKGGKSVDAYASDDDDNNYDETN